jgi:D-inositol-3-phosphate glycosyltransferase
MSVYVRELARELGRRGHRVDVFTRRHSPTEDIVSELGKNARLIHLTAGDEREIHKLAIYPHLAQFVHTLEEFRRSDGRRRYDVVHSHYWLSGWVGRRAAGLWDAAHLVMFHTLGAVKNALGVGALEPQIRVVTEREVIHAADRVIAATEREQRELKHFYGATPGTIRVVPCGVNLDIFRPTDRRTGRQRIGVRDDEELVLYVGRIEPLKGIDRLLAAVGRLQKTRPVKLLIVGGDDRPLPEFQRLKELREELGVEDSVVFVGRVAQEDLRYYYSAADVFVLPSHHESFGMVALEALACETPVVATRVGGLESVVRDGETGCLLPDNEPHSLAEAIKELLSRTTPAIAEPGSLRASTTRFRWSEIAAAVIDEYRSLLDERAAEAS